MRLPAFTLAGLALLEVNTEHADPEAKSLLGVIGRKLHQGDRIPRYRVKAHTRRVMPGDHRCPNPAARVPRASVQWVLGLDGHFRTFEGAQSDTCVRLLVARC